MPFKGFLSLMVVMRYFKERQLLALAIFIELVIALGLIILLPLMTFRADWIIPVGAAGCAIFSWFLSYVMASASTILSKSQPIHHQSRIQRSSSNVKFLNSFNSKVFFMNLLKVFVLHWRKVSWSYRIFGWEAGFINSRLVLFFHW